MASQSADSMESRFALYLSYAARLMAQQKDNISRLVNKILIIAGKIDSFVEVNVEFGPAISPGIEKQMNEAQREIDTLGTSDAVLKRVLSRLQFAPSEQEEVIKDLKTKHGTISIIDRLRQRNERNKPKL